MGRRVDSQLAIVMWKLSPSDQIRFEFSDESGELGWGCHENIQAVPLEMVNFMFNFIFPFLDLNQILHMLTSNHNHSIWFVNLTLLLLCYRASIEIHQQVEKVQWLEQLITWWSWVWSSLEPPFNYFNSVQFHRMEDEVAVNSTISSKYCGLASIYGLIQWP